jgi:hypothetical protein
MNLSRFEEFKRLAEMQCKSSDWLCKQVALLLDECHFHHVNPGTADTGKLHDLEQKLVQLENRCLYEDKIHENLMEEYKDIIEDE